MFEEEHISIAYNVLAKKGGCQPGAKRLFPRQTPAKNTYLTGLSESVVLWFETSHPSAPLFDSASSMEGLRSG